MSCCCPLSLELTEMPANPSKEERLACLMQLLDMWVEAALGGGVRNILGQGYSHLPSSLTQGISPAYVTCPTAASSFAGVSAVLCPAPELSWQRSCLELNDFSLFCLLSKPNLNYHNLYGEQLCSLSLDSFEPPVLQIAWNNLGILDHLRAFSNSFPSITHGLFECASFQVSGSEFV